MKQLQAFFLSLFILIFFIQNGGMAQVWLPGYVVDSKGDTLNGEISALPDSDGMGFKIKYADRNGDKYLFTPESAREVHYVENKKPVKMISMDNSVKFRNDIYKIKPKVFLRVDREGFLSLYQYSHTNYSGNINGSSMPSKSVRFLLKKGNDDLFLITGRDEFLAYLSDCKNVRGMVTKKRLKPEIIMKVVDVYNSNCGK